MDVASPAALVAFAPAVNVVVPAGANHTLFAAIPLRISRLAVPLGTETLAGN